MTPIPENKHFVFIAGVHRSGTSLIHEALRAHPDISGFQNTGQPEDEGQHLQSVFPTARKFGGPGRFAFDPASFMDETHPLATPDNAARLFADWSKHWDLGKDHLIEKSPPTIVRTRFFQALFPRSSFVIILRHPIAVAYATRKWCPAPIVDLLDHTLRCYERFVADKQRLQKLFVMRYEDFVDRPQEVLQQVQSFVGVVAHAWPREIDRQSNRNYFTRWQRDIETLQVQASAAAFEDRMSAFGYSLNSLETVRPVGWIDTGRTTYEVPG